MLKNIVQRYRYYFIFFIALLVIGSIIFIKKGDTSDPVVVDAMEIKKEESNNVNPIETYTIDIKGAVKNPGVYKIVKGSIINDVIEIAGGLKKDAYTLNINLSKKVTDEMVIYIYTKSEYNKLNKDIKSDNIKECSSKNNSYDITDCINNGNSSIITSNSNPEPNNNENISINLDENNKLININTASKEELMTLTGIGESKADCIIEYRNKNNGFKSTEEIMNISGIGEASFAKIKDFITV